MPRKAKYTREEIVQIALDFVAARGMEALNARNLAAALGTSTRPLFTAFKNMGELVEEIHFAAMKRFVEYAKKTGEDTPAFKSVGMQMILFAAEQPKLFQMLFMSEEGLQIRAGELSSDDGGGSFDDMFNGLGETSRLCMEYIMRDYGLNEREAQLLFRNTWLFTFGICALIANGVCSYDEKEVSQMLSTEFRSVMGLILSGKAFEEQKYQKELSPQEFKERFRT